MISNPRKGVVFYIQYMERKAFNSLNEAVLRVQLGEDFGFDMESKKSAKKKKTFFVHFKKKEIHFITYFDKKCVKIFEKLTIFFIMRR